MSEHVLVTSRAPQEPRPVGRGGTHLDSEHQRRDPAHGGQRSLRDRARAAARRAVVSGRGAMGPARGVTPPARGAGVAPRLAVVAVGAEEVALARWRRPEPAGLAAAVRSRRRASRRLRRPAARRTPLRRRRPCGRGATFLCPSARASRRRRRRRSRTCQSRSCASPSRRAGAAARTPCAPLCKMAHDAACVLAARGTVGGSAQPRRLGMGRTARIQYRSSRPERFGGRQQAQGEREHAARAPSPCHASV